MTENDNCSNNDDNIISIHYNDGHNSNNNTEYQQW